MSGTLSKGRRLRLPNPHPGEILEEEFLKPMKLSQTALARAIAVPPRRINEIVRGKRAITADTDLPLARYFGMLNDFYRPTNGLRTDGKQARDHGQAHGNWAASDPACG
jgi:antitoxin HigA-1